jgi:hypothetical protein
MSRIKEHMFDIIEGVDQALVDGASTLEEIMIHLKANGVVLISGAEDFVKGYVQGVLG